MKAPAASLSVRRQHGRDNLQYSDGAGVTDDCQMSILSSGRRGGGGGGTDISSLGQSPAYVLLIIRLIASECFFLGDNVREGLLLTSS